MAAVYLCHLAQNHPFVHGNKRTGAVAAIAFLSLNGIELEADEAQLEKLVLEVAQGKAGKDAEGRSPSQWADRGPVQETSGKKTVRWLDSGGVTVKR
jgi:prophage maintenance system killer protein